MRSAVFIGVPNEVRLVGVIRRDVTIYAFSRQPAETKHKCIGLSLRFRVILMNRGR